MLSMMDEDDAAAEAYVAANTPVSAPVVVAPIVNQPVKPAVIIAAAPPASQAKVEAVQPPPVIVNPPPAPIILKSQMELDDEAEAQAAETAQTAQTAQTAPLVQAAPLAPQAAPQMASAVASRRNTDNDVYFVTIVGFKGTGGVVSGDAQISTNSDIRDTDVPEDKYRGSWPIEGTSLISETTDAGYVFYRYMERFWEDSRYYVFDWVANFLPDPSIPAHEEPKCTWRRKCPLSRLGQGGHALRAEFVPRTVSISILRNLLTGSDGKSNTALKVTCKDHAIFTGHGIPKCPGPITLEQGTNRLTKLDVPYMSTITVEIITRSSGWVRGLGSSVSGSYGTDDKLTAPEINQNYNCDAGGNYLDHPAFYIR